MSTYLTATQTRTRYGGRSDMWLHRMLHDEKAAFPKPIKLRGQRYWLLADLIEWEQGENARCEQAEADGQRLSRVHSSAQEAMA
jgi:predicted DNA-binding transcriptional regulator AlpA